MQIKVTDNPLHVFHHFCILATQNTKKDAISSKILNKYEKYSYSSFNEKVIVAAFFIMSTSRRIGRSQKKSINQVNNGNVTAMFCLIQELNAAGSPNGRHVDQSPSIALAYESQR